MSHSNFVKSILHPGVLALVLGILASLTFAPFNMQWLSFIIWAPLIYLIRSSKSIRNAGGIGLVFGASIMGCFHIWMFSLTQFTPLWSIGLVWLVYSLYLGAFYGIMAMAIRAINIRFLSWIVAPPIWTLFEYLRTIGPIGNPGGIVGYSISQMMPLPLLASVGGVLFVSFFIISINALLADLPFREWEIKLATCFIVFIILGFGLATGQWATYHYKQNQSLATAVTTIVQGNHPQMDKFSPMLWTTIRNDYVALTRSAPTSDMIIWPETIIPTLTVNSPNFIDTVTHLAREQNAVILYGSPTQKSGHYYNSMVSISPTETVSVIYSKSKLMPFGEYWPFRNTLSAIGLSKLLTTDYTSGKNPIVIQAAGIKLGSAICLESLFKDPYRLHTQHGATLLIALANTAWFGTSSAAEKYEQMTRYRAIENGRWLVLSSNTGTSEIISPIGEVAAIPPNTRGILTKRVSLEDNRTIYTNHGDWILAVCLITIGLIGGIQIGVRHKKSQ